MDGNGRVTNKDLYEAVIASEERMVDRMDKLEERNRDNVIGIKKELVGMRKEFCDRMLWLERRDWIAGGIVLAATGTLVLMLRLLPYI